VSKTSLIHEAPLDVMRERPAVLLDVLATAGVSLPIEAARLEVVLTESSMTEVAPAHWSADLVAVVGEPGSPPKLIVVVEVQRDRDPSKRYAWAQYVMALATRHRAPVLLLVWVFDAAIATWARGPHELGPGFAFTPLVIGPGSLPIMSRDDAAEHLELAVLVALTQLGRRDQPLSQAATDQVLRVASAVLALEDHERRRRYLSLLHGTAPASFRAILKPLLEANHMRALELIREEGREEGRQEGQAVALVRLLRRRGFTVDDATEARILATADLARLDAWLDRVLTASSLEEVLGD
jgi:hypothetical protein